MAFMMGITIHHTSPGDEYLRMSYSVFRLMPEYYSTA
eukprot:CAMPEP_0206043244 /NCGR_PEP_ID=MMETSP1466-20131121/8304_1 /ASSEMBLY_ACC=CAM_ASM_001126 /TAXON_ID=44452 /ORGANISM="Pavlova gyrans, Strain CCMP608" /LENGTH=36 /DNA_ID= /DNA_START= /DNA_END= /DNA_ORIENTATION=